VSFCPSVGCQAGQQRCFSEAFLTGFLPFYQTETKESGMDA